MMRFSSADPHSHFSRRRCIVQSPVFRNTSIHSFKLVKKWILQFHTGVCSSGVFSSVYISDETNTVSFTGSRTRVETGEYSLRSVFSLSNRQLKYLITTRAETDFICESNRVLHSQNQNQSHAVTIDRGCGLSV